MKRGSFGLEVQPRETAAALHGICHAFYKTISVILYLLDLVSNAYVAYQYYEFDVKHKHLENMDHYGRKARSPPTFVIMVSLMVFGHVSCFIFFLSVGLPGDEHPLQLCKFLRRALSRYLLPVAQFLRALEGLECCPFSLNEDSRLTARDEARVEALYAIVSATTDGGPLFLLQYLALTLNTVAYDNPWKPGRWLVLSLCLSALFAAWNVTRAIVFLVPLRSRLLALAAGAFTLSALAVRCTSLVSIIELQMSVRPIEFYIMLRVYLLLILVVPFIGYCFLSREGTSEVHRNALWRPSKSMLRAAGFNYINLSFGPRYPFVSVAETSTRMGVSITRFQTRLCFYATCRWMLEASLMSTLLIKKWSPCNDLWGELALTYSFDKASPGCPMMPCRLYIAILAIGFPVAVSSQVLFQKFVQIQAVDTFQNDNAEKETTLAATGAYEIGSTVVGIVGFT